MPIGQFKKPAASAAKAPAAKKSKWAGVKSSKPRDPVIHAGTYRVRVMRGLPGRTGEWFKVQLQIVAQADGQSLHADGDETVALFRTVDDAGQSRCKAFFVAAAGFDSDEAYNAYDSDGAKIDAFFEAGDDSDLAGRLVDLRVMRGKDTPDGDYYREYQWAPVSDEEQG